MLATRNYALLKSALVRGAVVVAALVLGASFSSSQVSAQCLPLSLGDATAFFQAFNNGGLAIRTQGAGVAGFEGAPSEGGRFGAIRGNPAFNGRHYCVDDWHVILVSSYVADYQPYSLGQARDDLAGQPIVELYLDGVRLTTTRSPLTPALGDFGDPNIVVYGFNEGTLMAPGSIGVGVHTMTDRVSWFGSPFVDRTITFYVDPSGSASCCH